MSASNLAELHAWLQPLLDRLQPPEVRRLARRLAVELRRRQSLRIAAQRNPDGTAYEPRRRARAPGRSKHSTMGAQRSERVRVKAMFSKLRTSAHLKTHSSATEAGIQIEGRSARIARVHQFGLLDRPQAGGPEVRYPARVLLGWSDSDMTALTATMQRYLNSA